MCLASLVVVVLMANRLRRSGVGRALVAVRDNEASAAAFTIAPRATKLSAFALAGGLAGFAGALLMALLTNARADQFPVDMSLSAVSMAVIGGLASAAGAVIGTLWVVGLPAIFGTNETVSLLTSGIGLLVLIMYFPGGLVQVAYAVRGVIVRAVERRLPPAAARPPVVRLAASTDATSAPCDDGPPAGVPDLAVHGPHGHVRRAADRGRGRPPRRPERGRRAHRRQRRRQDHDHERHRRVPPRRRAASSCWATTSARCRAARRAERGLGRSFQDARLFGDLTVLETVALAHERVLPTRMLAVLVGLPTWRRRDREQLARARDLVDYLGLGGYADHFVGTLSTGTRRICELACILALEPRVICLDEPTAGVAQRETEAFGPLITRIQAELGASMLVIEHDMPFVMAISDRVYCLETGTIIAEGPPDQVRHDPRVVASYLGTDERAIQRSGAAARGRRRPRSCRPDGHLATPSSTTPRREPLMPLHPAAQAIVDMMPADIEMPEITVENVEMIRELMGSLNATSAGIGPELASVEDRTIAGPGGDLPIRIYTPDGTGAAAGHDVVPRRRVLRRQHRRARHGVPPPGRGGRFDRGERRRTGWSPSSATRRRSTTALAALRWVAEHAATLGGDPGRSPSPATRAGGNLAAAVAWRARREAARRCGSRSLVYPVVDALRRRAPPAASSTSCGRAGR